MFSLIVALDDPGLRGIATSCACRELRLFRRLLRSGLNHTPALHFGVQVLHRQLQHTVQLAHVFRVSGPLRSVARSQLVALVLSIFSQPEQKLDLVHVALLGIAGGFAPSARLVLSGISPAVR
jgi:hypothetical protein